MKAGEASTGFSAGGASTGFRGSAAWKTKDAKIPPSL